MRIVYRGNFQVDFSTESHVAKSLETLGHVVGRHQEDAIPWSQTVEACRNADLFLWTSTYSMAHKWNQDVAHEVVRGLNALLPTAALHLDLFFGLNRATQVTTEPWFKLLHVFTADGDHEPEFQAAGVNHHLLLPAVYHAECDPGHPDDEFHSELAFVGGWQGGYHKEYSFRHDLVRWLVANYGSRCAFWPQGGHVVRGKRLNDLYASVKVVVGDSCFASTARSYTSDRLFETVGRGGFLVYPRIPAAAAALEGGKHCMFYTPGDFDSLRRAIEWSLVMTHDERQQIREAGQMHVREHHTYLNRLEELLAIVTA